MNRLSFFNKGLEGKQRAKKRERAVAVFVFVFLIFVLALLGWGLLDFFGLSVAKASWPSCDNIWTETENQNIGSYEQCGCAFMSCPGLIGHYDCASAEACTRTCYETGPGSGSWCYSSCSDWTCSPTTLYSGFSCGCGGGGCVSDSDCPPDDGCTDYYCDSILNNPGLCQGIDLCPNGNGGTPTPTPGGNPYFNVDIVQVSGTVSIAQGQVAAYDINIAPFNSYSGTANLSVSGCPATATCAFSAGSVTFTNDSPNPGISVLTVSNTANVTPGVYPLTVTGTDTVPEPDLVDADGSDLTITLSPAAICNNTWRDIPWETQKNVYGIVYMPYSSSYSAVADNSAIYLYSPFNYSGAYQQHGYQWTLCFFGLTPVCSWSNFVDSRGYDWSGVNSAQVYAQSPSSIFIFNALNGNTWEWAAPNNWIDRGVVVPEKPWNTPHSIFDKDGRFWEFRIVETIPPYGEAQYKCTPVAPPTCSSAGPVGWTTTATTGTHDVFAYGVSSYVTAVKFPTWGDPGGQDDIVWYPGTNMGSGTWKASVNLANHKAGNPEYGNINVHIYMDTALTPNTYCGSATFTRNPVNQPPTVPSVTVTEPDYCSSGPAAYVNWTYSDPEGDPQSAYQVQIDDQGSFGSPEVDTGKVSSGGTSYFASSGLAFNITYKTRVRVWDSHDSVSGWTESGSWKTPKHAYPYTDFIYAPSTDIPAKQPVQFTDQTTFYDGGGGQRTWSWLFGDGGTSNVQNPPPHTYNLPGLYNASLTATDKDNFSCSRTKPITIQLPVPVWKEVSPR